MYFLTSRPETVAHAKSIASVLLDVVELEVSSQNRRSNNGFAELSGDV